MLYEIPLSLAAIGIAAALIVPECTAILDQPEAIPSMTLVVGAIIGTFGVYGMASVLSTHENRLMRLLFMTICGGIAIGLSIGVGICAPRGPELWHRIALFVAASLPTVSFLTSLPEVFSTRR